MGSFLRWLQDPAVVAAKAKAVEVAEAERAAKFEAEEWRLQREQRLQHALVAAVKRQAGFLRQVGVGWVSTMCLACN